MTTTTDTATVTCICGSLIPAEGKHIHLCIAKSGRKVVSREYVGYVDGRAIAYGPTGPGEYTRIEVALDAYVAEQLAQTAAETADIAADADQALADAAVAAGKCPNCLGEGRYGAAGWGDQAGGYAQTCDDCGGTGKLGGGIPTCCGGQGCDACEDDNDDYGDALAEGAMGSYNGRTDRDARPTLADPAATRRYWCFVDGCSYEPRHIFGDIGLCCGHYGEYAKIWCDCPDSPFNVSADPPTDPDPGPGGDPWPDAPSIFRPVVAPSLLAEADAALTRSCLICGGDHSAEQCPRIQLAPLGCGACGGEHHIQACPDVRALLLAPAERWAVAA